MHYKWSIVSCLIILVTLPQAYGAGELKKYEESLEKWRRSGITHYRVKVEYRSFSPLSGIWELEVKDGGVVLYFFNGSSDKRYTEAAKKFTVELIYKKGVPSVETNQNSPVIIKTEFDSETGYVKSVRKIRNPEFTGKIRKDSYFLINIIELKPLQ